MWIKVTDEPIPTYGMDGRTFRLWICYQAYYGHYILMSSNSISAIWDSTNECFYETSTMLEVDDREIVQWWKELDD